MISLNRHLYGSTIFLLLCSIFVSSEIAKLDLCGGNGHIDSHALNTGFMPWNVAKSYVKNSEVHHIDISPCDTLEHYSSNFIPKECKNSHICHNITINGKTTSLGYNLTFITPEFGTVRAVYVGPKCEDQQNYTINIRYICGNHLGHPSFPIYDLKSKCTKILNWETSAACKDQEQSSNFGLNEMRCYVIDDQNAIRDLTPLIRSNGSYAVMNSVAEEFYINVCTDVADKCNIQGSSACKRSSSGVFESFGSYKWSDIKFVAANDETKHEYVEITYRMTKAECRPNNAVTRIRFVCPKSFSVFGSIHREPTLISELDCENIIEWVTDYACPMNEITQSVDTCEYEQIDLKKLKKTEFVFKDSNIPDNKSIILNICGGVSKKCANSVSVCLFDENQNKGIGSRKEGKFVKAENQLNMMFTSKSAHCVVGNNHKLEKTIIQFKCDKSAVDSVPKFIGYSNTDCLYEFEWKTNIVCPLFEDLPDCSYVGYNQKNQLIQVDLSSLRLNSSFYTALRDPHEPSRNYALPLNQEIKFNVCGRIPSSTKLPDACKYSAACLVDPSIKLALSIGRIAKPLTYNENLDSFELIYTDGFDPRLNRAVSTKIIFLCRSFDNQPYLIEFDDKNQQYVIEFSTVAACPMSRVKGSGCMVTDPITGNTFDLRPLKTKEFYVIRTEDEKYEFELNICDPVLGGSCSPGTAICQKELQGGKRNFSLGVYTDTVYYWNSILNMTFTDGDKYNDADKTPRKSQISFICDPNVEHGNPEFIGEFNRSYSFVWYTSLACNGPVHKRVNCVFENATHIIDLSPLSLERGNHFALGDNQSIVYINFCRSLNRIRNNQLEHCQPNSAACVVESFDQSHSALNLGEPYVPPMLSNEDEVIIHYNNGDKCESNESEKMSTVLKLRCDKESGQDLRIMMVEPDFRPECTYEFIVYSPIACATKLSDASLKNCVYTDKRTNLSADFGSLFVQGEREISGQKLNSKFLLNFCKPIESIYAGECVDAAVCFRDAGSRFVSYGKWNKLKVYFDENLHLRFTDGTRCDKAFDDRRRSADVEFICDPNAPISIPVLYYQDECLAKFKWKTPAVCSLKVPSCSLYDDNGYFYSLRQLSSLSHSWKVKSSNPKEHYLLNVCKPLPLTEECGPSSSVCKCRTVNDKIECNTSIGKVSDHELTLDNETKHLLLTYEDDKFDCNGKPQRTQIQFQCSKEMGIKEGPQFVNVNDCTHYFVWNTSFACAHNLISHDELVLNRDFVLEDRVNNLEWNLHDLFSKRIVVEETRLNDKYEYVFRFVEPEVSTSFTKCSQASVCQTNGKDFYRDIGSFDNWEFIIDDTLLHMIIRSKTSKCGRNPSKFATTKIFFECADDIQSELGFLYESEDCEYYFLWKTSSVCPVIFDSSSMKEKNHQKSSSIILPLSLLIMFIFVAFLVYKAYYNHEINIRECICRQMSRFRGNTSTNPDVNFRYHQYI